LIFLLFLLLIFITVVIFKLRPVTIVLKIDQMNYVVGKNISRLCAKHKHAFFANVLHAEQVFCLGEALKYTALLVDPADYFTVLTAR